jgi:hypothetical protein
MRRVICLLSMVCVITAAALSPVSDADDAINLRLTLRDTDTGELVPGRITLEQRPVGGPHVYHFVKSLAPEGTAIPYDVTRGPDSFEKHTTVSAHLFGASVPPGLYVVYYEHGPEWRGNKAQVWVKEGEVAEQELPISRWIDMNERGWYSGDTHVHRTVKDLPNVMRSEDLNVALPLSYWIRDAYSPPVLEDRTYDESSRLITVDDNRVIWPMNTEYELFTLNGQRHTQGAVFVLNHKQRLTLATPPVAPVADEARRQGALLDLDKHSWPWSMMLVPIMDVDLFELSNNHIWRTEFFFKQWTQEMRPEGWNIETDGEGFTEWGWIDFGFKSYYALLNCGFRMRPTAGTANGVHPVPLGFGRVYVECPDGFSYDNWMKGLDAGRSFVTTGPMLFATVNDQPPGSTIEVDGPTSVRVQGSVESYGPIHRIEIVRNGRVVDVVPVGNDYQGRNVWHAAFDIEVPVETSSWIAVRCFAGRTDDLTAFRFAHTSPVHIEIPGRPLRPRKIETDYLVQRMQQEIDRNRELLRPDELAEYERARDIYARLAETAVDERESSNEEVLSLVIPAADLPEGWGLTDISDTEMAVLGTNPAIVSRPDMVRQVQGVAGIHEANQKNRAIVLRSVLAFYYNPKANQSALLSVHVCFDEASAGFTADLISDPPNRTGRIQTWHRGDLAVCVSASKEMPDSLFAAFKTAVQTRLDRR